MRQIIIPRDDAHWHELRRAVLTSTDIPALFGISEYLTAFELFYRKKDKTEVAFDPNVRMLWGLRLESAIAEGVAKDNGWTIRKMDEFIYDDSDRLGCSFDYSLNDEEALLEIKNLDSLQFKNKWLVDGDNIEASPYVELQAQVQLLVSGRKYIQIAGLVGGNKVVLIRREPSPKIHTAIKQKCAEFWKSIDENKPPAPNFETDSKFIASLYNYSEPGKIISVAEDEEIVKMAERYRENGELIKAAEARRDEIKAKILTAIGDAEKATGGNFTVSAGMVGPAHVEYDLAGYRMFKITWKKGA